MSARAVGIAYEDLVLWLLSQAGLKATAGRKGEL
jgi:hypothetical protein